MTKVRILFEPSTLYGVHNRAFLSDTRVVKPGLHSDREVAASYAGVLLDIRCRETSCLHEFRKIVDCHGIEQGQGGQSFGGKKPQPMVYRKTVKIKPNLIYNVKLLRMLKAKPSIHSRKKACDLAVPEHLS